MLILDYAAGAVIRVGTSSTANIECEVSGVDHTISGDVFLAFQQHTAIAATPGPTTIGAGPASGHVRNYKRISLRNKHASTANTLTIESYNGTLAVQLDVVTLAAGEKWLMDDKGVIFVYDALGGVKMGASAASDTVAGVIMLASVAEMEADTDVTKACVPGRLDRHPAAVKFWLKAGVTGNLLASYNVTSLTDTGTGVMAITIATDFSGADYAVSVSVEATATTWAVANARECHIRSATLAAGTLSVDCIDNTVTTCLVKDPTSWHVVGLGDQA